MLTAQQQAAAAALLAERPPVIPGTRAIVYSYPAQAWHRKVGLKMEELGIDDSRTVNEFCDAAGVAD